MSSESNGAHQGSGCIARGRLTPLYLDRMLDVIRQRGKMLRQTSEQLSLLSVGGQIPDQDAFCRVRSKLLEMSLHILHLGSAR